MGAVFVSYRRGDSEGQARALLNELTDYLGKDSVFMDVDGIGLGRDFRQILNERLGSCDQMLALIGTNWLDIQDAHGNRRLESATDFVRQEIAAALKRNIPVTPVLVQGAKMPDPERLPDDLKDLVFRNGFELSHQRWESDVRELIKRLGLSKGHGVVDQSPGPAETYRHRTPRPWFGGWSVRLAAAGVGALILATSGYLAGTRLRSEDRTPAGQLKAETPADSCVAPYVWRLAVPSDHVCVTTESRNRVELENQRAPERRAGGGPYGPDSCLTGYVWREAFDGDTVCVSPDRREDVRKENTLASQRIKR